MRNFHFLNLKWLRPLHLRPVPEDLDSEASGVLGEKIAASYLKSQGYKILVKNYRTKWGEIDISCRHEDTLVFVEVKTRSIAAWARPAEAVGDSKKRKLIRTAYAYLSELKEKDIPVRFDVVEVLLESGNLPDITLLRNAFQTG